MNKSESIGQLAKALSAFQGELGAAPKSEANPFFKSRYADLASVWDTCHLLLGKHGLAVSQLPSLDGDRLVLTTMLMHSTGEWLSSDLLMTPNKMDPQAVGSALTYARRYALCAILGVVADDDDDAEAAMGRPAQPSPARMPEAVAMAPKGLCPIHKVPFVRRQGTSKAGKAFDFWACPQKVGDDYCKERPKEAHQAPEPKSAEASPDTPTTYVSVGTYTPIPPTTHASADMTSEQFMAAWKEAGWPDFKTQADKAWQFFQRAVGHESIGAARNAGMRYDEMLARCREAAAQEASGG